jgi:hypothetical protein
MRVKGRCMKDGVEGWITIKGNAGSVYAKQSDKLYSVKHEVALQQKFASGSEIIRVLTVGEAVETLEGPREEKIPPVSRAKVRTRENVCGWITVTSTNVKSWVTSYKCIKASSLFASKDVNDTDVRELAQGESLEWLDGPEDVNGEMWLKARLKRDGAIGWALLKKDGVRAIVAS